MSGNVKTSLGSPSSETIHFGHTAITKRKDGIIEVNCGDDVEYKVHHLLEMHEATGKLCDYKRHPVLFKVGKYTHITKEARDYGATEEACLYSSAEAYVIQSLMQGIFSNFYLKMNKPPVPTKFFNSETEAETWLKTFS